MCRTMEKYEDCPHRQDVGGLPGNRLVFSTLPAWFRAVISGYDPQRRTVGLSTFSSLFLGVNAVLPVQNILWQSLQNYSMFSGVTLP